MNSGRRRIALLAGFLLAVAATGLATASGLDAAYGDRGLTGWDVLVELIADPYLLSFVAVPAFLVGCAAGAPTSTGWEHLVRFGSRTRAAASFATEHVLAAAPFLAGWLVVDVLIAARFGFAGGWGPVALAGGDDSPIMGYVAPYLAPVAAIACQLVLVVCAAWAGATALALLAVWTDGTRLLRWACALLWLWTLLSFKIAGGAPPSVRPITYLTVHHAVQSGASPWLFALGSVLIGCALLAVGRVAERSRVGMRRPRGLGLYAVIALALLVGTEVAKAAVSEDGSGGILTVFFGVGTERLDLTAVVVNLLLTAGAALTVHAGLVDRLGNGPYPQLIRCRSATHWWWRTHLRGALVVAVAVPLGALALHVAAMSALHGTPDLGPDGARYALFLVVATAAQICVYVLLMSAATFLSGRAIAGVWVLGLALAGSLPVLVRTSVLPVAQNSLSRLWDGEPARTPLLVLALWGVAAFAATAWALRRRGADIS